MANSRTGKILDFFLPIWQQNIAAAVQSTMMKWMTKSSLLGLAIVVIAGCSTIPNEIRQVPPGNPPLVEVRANVDRYIGQHMRWGGTIVSIDNASQETRLEIVGRNLYDNGRPTESDQSNGRFIAEFVGFLDPSVYSKGRDITVVGVIAGDKTGKIGDFEYTWPVVRVHDYYLWPLPSYQGVYYPSRYYYYDPWYPYYYYPYGIYQPIVIAPPEPAPPPRSSPLKR